MFFNFLVTHSVTPSASSDLVAPENAVNLNTNCPDHSSSFALQTSGSRISTLDMLPQLLQAESDLAEVARSLQTPPTAEAFQFSEKVELGLSSLEQLKNFNFERSPSPHRLSHLIASLEAAQQHLASDVIDLRSTPPPAPLQMVTDIQLATTAQSSALDQTIDLPFIDENGDVKGKSSSNFQQQQQKLIVQQQKSVDTSRVVAELDNLCDTLFEMKCSLGEAKNLPTTDKDTGEFKQQQLSEEKTKTTENKRRHQIEDEVKRQKEQQQLQLQHQLLDENLLFTFDQLTASINKLILEGTEQAADGKESPTKMVIPPPPPDSPTQLKEQDEIIKRFWEATKDVKTMITFRKQKQLQRQQQQQQSARLQQQQQEKQPKQTKDHHQKLLHLERKQAHLQHQFTTMQNCVVDISECNTTTSASGQFSSDSTAVNSSSDSESDVTLGNSCFQLPDDSSAMQRYFQRHKQQQQQQQQQLLEQQQQQQQLFVSSANQQMIEQVNTRFPFTNVNLRHYQHYQPRGPQLGTSENTSHFPTSMMPHIGVLQHQQQQPQQQFLLNENLFYPMTTTAGTVSHFGVHPGNLDVNNTQVL